MAKLELFLLGTPQIVVDGQTITNFNTRKDQALLVYLAVTGATHSRESLASLLWSDLPEEKARRNLRHALSHLQKAIGSQWLTTERGVALVQAYPWSVDVHTLRVALKSMTASSAHTAGRAISPTIDALQQALQLYRGEFLQGFHLHDAVYFEEWVLAQREELRLLTLRGLEALVEACQVQGAYEQGLAATQRLLQLEPWSEPAHCLQMQLLAQSGRRTAALAQYELCRKVLVTELDVEPLATTTALYQQIKSGAYHRPVTLMPSLPQVGQAAVPPVLLRQAVADKTVPHNLLTPLSAFIGRQREVALICQRLPATACRLLTIVGPGGIGKTSLAQAVAQQLLQVDPAPFPEGIYFVALAAFDPVEKAGQVGDLLATNIAERIGCDLQPGPPPQVQLQAYLRHRRLLLILDNFEHLLNAADTVLALLNQAPILTVLITSRSRLNLRGETVLALPKLSLPSATVADNDWAASEAVAMFVQRTQCLDPYFTINAENYAAIRQICQLVDGLPLGIELATSMLPMLSCTTLANELTQSLAFLEAETVDLPVDQRSLRTVFERSWRLLAPPEQMLLAKLAIWPGTFDWEALQAVAETSRSLLLRLIHQSLVNTTADGRYSLHPLVRTFALEKLEQTPAEAHRVRGRYARFYLDFLAQKEAGLKGVALTVTCAEIYLELDNIRLAWRWAVTYQLYNDLLAAMHTLFLFYEFQGLYTEAVEQAEGVLRLCLADDEAQNQANDSALNLLIGRLQTYWGGFSMRLGRVAQADNALRASLARLQQRTDPFATAFCLSVWGSILRGRDIQQAKILLSEAAHQVQTIDDGWLKAWIYLTFGEVNQLLGDYPDAMIQYTKGYNVAEQVGCAWGLVHGQRWLGRLSIVIGDYQRAEIYLRNCAAYAHHQNMKVVWIEANTYLGEALRLQGRFAEAKVCYTQSRQQAEALQHKFLLAQAIWAQGTLAEQGGDYATALALFTESRAKGHPNLWAQLLPTLGWALIGLGDLAGAYRYFTHLLTDDQLRQFPPVTLDAEVGLAYLTALRPALGAPHLAAPSYPSAGAATVFQRVYQHPSAMQETRARVARLAPGLAISLVAGSELPASHLRTKLPFV